MGRKSRARDRWRPARGATTSTCGLEPPPSNVRPIRWAASDGLNLLSRELFSMAAISLCLQGPTVRQSIDVTRYYCDVTRVTIAFEGADLELVERACRALAECARRDAESAKGSAFEQIHQGTQRRFLGMAERLKVARRLPDREPPPPSSDLWRMTRH